MSVIHMTQELRGKPVISIVNGNVLAWLEDVLVAPNMRQVAAAVTYGSDALNLQSRAIPGGKIRVWGRDALLTDRPDIANRPGDSREMETWPRVVRQLKGRKVITAAGTHIGTLYDLIINDRGQILDYDLSEVMIEGPIAYSRQVPADAYRLLQSDALIVDASRLE